MRGHLPPVVRVLKASSWNLQDSLHRSIVNWSEQPGHRFGTCVALNSEENRPQCMILQSCIKMPDLWDKREIATTQGTHTLHTKKKNKTEVGPQDMSFAACCSDQQQGPYTLLGGAFCCSHTFWLEANFDLRIRWLASDFACSNVTSEGIKGSECKRKFRRPHMQFSPPPKTKPWDSLRLAAQPINEHFLRCQTCMVNTAPRGLLNHPHLLSRSSHWHESFQQGIPQAPSYMHFNSLFCRFWRANSILSH